MRKKIVLFTSVLFCIVIQSNAQCIQCSAVDDNLGINASRLGTTTIASGHSAFASGYVSTASGNYSTAVGYNAIASGMYSIAIGKNAQAQNTSFAFGRDIKASSSNSIIIGSGYSSSAIMTNNIAKSIMFGVNSSTPSITIRQTSTQDVAALVGVGTTNPQQSLHVEGNAMISGTGKGLLFATSSTTTAGDFGIRYTGTGLNFFLPGNGTPTNYLVFIKDNGNIGIGTSNPSTKLDVSGTAKATSIVSTTSLQSATLNVSGNVTFSNLSDSTSKVVTVSNDGTLSSADYSTFSDNMGNHTATQNINLNGNKMVGSSSGTGGIFVATNGNVRIGAGTATPTKALEVNGTMRSKEVVVEIDNWSDFVFDNNYNLMSLSDTEKYINANGHLPEVPTAKEVEADGVQLGEMNAILLQKIEELTLHVIELEKQIKELTEGGE